MLKTIKSLSEYEQLYNEYVTEGHVRGYLNYFISKKNISAYINEEKIKYGDFWKEFCGFGGFDAMLTGMITEGVHRRGLSLQRLSQLTSQNAANIMGISSKKGSLLPGKDADILVVDLNKEWVFDGRKSLSKTKSIHNIYHGMHMTGKVLQTYVRGSLVYDDGKICVPNGYGKYIPKQR